MPVPRNTNKGVYYFSLCYINLDLKLGFTQRDVAERVTLLIRIMLKEVL